MARDPKKRRAGEESEDPALPTDTELFKALLERSYQNALAINESKDTSAVERTLGATLTAQVLELARTRHAARGVALTLLLYKAINPKQDIRRHKAEQEGGFAARTYDSAVTVPFLMAKSLERNVESHWLTQTFSFAGPFDRGLALKTRPDNAGPLMLEVVNLVEESSSPDVAEAAATLILSELIEIRSLNKVALTRPKNITIETTLELIEAHFAKHYKTGAPRLPQLAMYAIYRCIVSTVARYEGTRLEPLMRMKAADRKSGTVGDVVVTANAKPVEAVEVKLDEPISERHVSEAIEKIRSATVRRYLILSTADVDENQRESINRLRHKFRSENGCEIIVNGILPTLKYYLRLLRDPSDFLMEYVELVEGDPDLAYEHRVAWNAVCSEILG